MKKYLAVCLYMAITVGIVSGCGNSTEEATAPPQNDLAIQNMEEGYEPMESAANISRLEVRFGDEGEPFIMQLEENDTAQTIAAYVADSSWRLPIYSYDESAVMQYYDLPSRFVIPSSGQNVTEAYAGDVFYSDPNRIVLYYHDAEISEEYTKIGSFEATDEFVAAVENNPVLEGWGNQIILINSAEE